MKTSTLLAAGLACCVVACGSGQQPQSPETSTPANMAAAESPPGEKAIIGNAARISHMHLHAEQLDRLNGALAAGDLAVAQSAAYWLARHEDAPDIRASWQPHLAMLREAATAVEVAPDVATALSGAQRIVDSCNGCHVAVGVDKVVAQTGATQASGSELAVL